MSNTDIRWHQRLDNYTRALGQLELAVQLASKRALSDLEKQGLIQAFEFTHELAWKVMKDYFFFQGQSDITGSRDATRAAYSNGLIQDGESWMEMIKSRNQTSHTYNKQVADEIVQHITETYHTCFKQFLEKMEVLKTNG
jgi:nucleotidyltransferase substrate binding protein (TIGR01987 family)